MNTWNQSGAPRRALGDQIRFNRNEEVHAKHEIGGVSDLFLSCLGLSAIALTPSAFGRSIQPLNTAKPDGAAWRLNCKS